VFPGENSASASAQSNYKYHSPIQQAFNYKVPVSQLPRIGQFFPNLRQPKPIGIMNEIKEINNDWEVLPVTKFRERTNSDNWPDNV
jgi:hypothetical protein